MSKNDMMKNELLTMKNDWKKAGDAMAHTHHVLNKPQLDYLIDLANVYARCASRIEHFIDEHYGDET